MNDMRKIEIPGSKSITNRALILAAISDKPVILKGILESDDSRYMQEALRQFGVDIEPVGVKSIKVTPPVKLKARGAEIFIGNAGTAARFLSALSLVIEGDYILKGVDRMHERPQSDLLGVLHDQLGVEVKCLKTPGFLPAQFSGNRRDASTCVSEKEDMLINLKEPDAPFNLKTQDAPQRVSTEIQVSGRVSSQFLSGLLLIGAKLPTGLKIKITDSIPSLPYVQMTIEMLKLWGIKTEINENWTKFDIFPGLTAPEEYQIPADMSAASYPVAWSLLKKEPVEITNFGKTTLQGDEQFLNIAERCGAQVERIGDTCKITPGKNLQSLGDVNWESMPDVSMTGMVLASFAPEGTASTFTGLESLRVKECDRIGAMQQLEKLGVKFEVSGDDIVIHGAGDTLKAPESKIEINSFDDHRIAFCFGILKTALNLGSDPHQESNIQITEPECVSKTWPEFWLELSDWQDQLRPVAGMVVKKGDEFLIVKKPRTSHAWQFPQGGADEGETLKQTALRELAEECGEALNVKIKGERPIGEYKYLFPAHFERWVENLVGAKVEFLCADYISGEVVVDGDELIDHAWVTEDQLGDYFEGKYFKAIKNLSIHPVHF